MASLIVLRDDMAGISNEEILYRRVSFESLGGNNPSLAGQTAELNKNAFPDFRAEKAAEMGYAGPCMSVALHSVLLRENKTAAALLNWGPDYGVAAVSVGALRELTRFDGTACPQGVMASPTADEPWHGVVFDLSGLKRPDPAAKRIAKIARWEIPLVHHA